MDTHEQNNVAQAQGFDDAELELLQADPELAGMFFAEALDHLGSIESTVLALEAAPGDVKLLNDLFRPFHTIKGNSGALGITSVQAVAHKVENLLDLGRSGTARHRPGRDRRDPEGRRRRDGHDPRAEEARGRPAGDRTRRPRAGS